MKKLLFICGLLWSAVASAQFTPGQLLTAAELNNQFALYAPLTGATFTGPISATDLSSSGTLSGIGFTNLLSPYLLSTTAASTYAPITGSSNYAPASGSSVYATITNLALKSPIANPTFTGTVTIPSGASISGYLTTASASTTYAPIASPTFTGTVTIPGGASISGFALLASPTFTGTPAAPTASAGTNTTQLATTAFVSASPTITTPNLVGVTNGSSAATGSVGQYITNTTSGTSLTTATVTACTSQSLTAGQYLVWGSVTFAPSVGISYTNVQGGVSTSATAYTILNAAGSSNFPANVASTGIDQAIPPTVLNLSSTTTIYIVGNATFTTGTMTCNGYFQALRVR